MDKDPKDMITPEDNAYDPDAAELLKDLGDDDDDDEFQPEKNAPRSNSLLNILSSSANLVAVTAPGAYDPAKAAQNAPDESEAAKTVKDFPVVDSVKVPEVPAVPPRNEDAVRVKPVPPEEPRVKAPHIDDSLRPKSLTDISSVPPVAGKRPPGPPPKPSLASVPRVLNDNEILLTKEALSDMLPGGKNDEARDLGMLKFPDNPWYTTVFNEDYLRTVPRTSVRQTIREAKFIIDRLGIQSGARVLDLCCGFGRHTIELSTKGFDMVGLDLSMVMLKKALADAQARNQAIKFVHGDMRKLAFKGIFDAIYNVQTSFGYFDDQSNYKVLQGVFNALKPGGVFLIETINRDFLVNDLPMRLWWKGVDCMLLEEIDIEHISGLLKVQRSFVFEDNQRPPVEQKIQIRLYTAIEMRTLLIRAGFNVVELSGDYSLPNAYFGATSPRNIFIAEKPIK